MIDKGGVEREREGMRESECVFEVRVSPFCLALSESTRQGFLLVIGS